MTYTEIEKRDFMKKVIPFSKTVHFKTMIAEVTDIEVKHTLKITENQTIEGDILVDGTYKMTEASQIEEPFHYTLPFTIEVDDKYDIRQADIGIHDFYFEIINEEDLKVNVELEISKVKEKSQEMTEEEDEKVIEAIIDSEISSEEEKENHKEDEREEAQSIPVETDPEIEKVEILENQENASVPLQENGFDSFLPKKEEIFEEETVEEAKQSNQPSTILENTKITLEEKPQVTAEDSASSESQSTVPSIFSSINQEETFVTYYVYIVREHDTIESILEKYHASREEVAAYNDLNQIKVGSKIIIPCSHE